MTPAIDTLDEHKVAYKIHRYQHHPDALSYGQEACEALKVEPTRVFKTIVLEIQNKQVTRKQFVVVLVPVSALVNLKAVATTLKCKRATMAEADEVNRTTGYQLGGVSPLGQKTRLTTLIDDSAIQYSTIFISAGKRGLELEIATQLLIELCSAKTAMLARFE